MKPKIPIWSFAENMMQNVSAECHDVQAALLLLGGVLTSFIGH